MTVFLCVFTDDGTGEESGASSSDYTESEEGSSSEEIEEQDDVSRSTKGKGKARDTGDSDQPMDQDFEYVQQRIISCNAALTILVAA